MKELILGGARSGKSDHAQQRASRAGLAVTYVATATAGDEEMVQRIRQHQSKRPSAWTLVEEPITLAAALAQYAGEQRCVLVDCLTLWLSNLLTHPSSNEVFERERGALLEILPALAGDIIFVSNEVGTGIVPTGKLSRVFVDEAGRLHQELARLCDRVTFMVAGLPHILKGE